MKVKISSISFHKNDKFSFWYLPVQVLDIHKPYNHLPHSLHQFQCPRWFHFGHWHSDLPSVEWFVVSDVDSDTFEHFEPIVDPPTTVKYLYLDLNGTKQQEILRIFDGHIQGQSTHLLHHMLDSQHQQLPWPFSANYRTKSNEKWFSQRTDGVAIRNRVHRANTIACIVLTYTSQCQWQVGQL